VKRKFALPERGRLILERETKITCGKGALNRFGHKKKREREQIPQGHRFVKKSDKKKRRPVGFIREKKKEGISLNTFISRKESLMLH